MDKTKILKCPGCGDLPKVFSGVCGDCCVTCMHYACDFYYSVITNNKTSAIKAWNEAVLKYEENTNG